MKLRDDIVGVDDPRRQMHIIIRINRTIDRMENLNEKI
jgi:hypothetical protein